MGKYVEIGKITKPHALRGELKMIYFCDEAEVLNDIREFFLDIDGKNKLDVETIRLHKNFFIIKFKDIEDIEEAQKYINKILYIPKDLIKLEEGEYLQCDLIGVRVFDVESKEEYGEIFKITQTGANDVYYIKNEEGRELLIPAIKDVIKEVDIQNKVMKIKPLDGLFEI